MDFNIFMNTAVSRAAAGLPTLKLAPALGWPLGGFLAALMVVAAVLCVVDYVHGHATGDDADAMSAQSDGTAASTKSATDETTWNCTRRTLICLGIAAMALTPSVTQTTQTRAVNATDVVIATDVTGSMAVQDAQYGSPEAISRIDAAKKAIDDVVRLYPDSSFSALRFGASASTDVPLTPDSQAILGWTDGLEPEATNTSVGSTLDTPIDQLLVNLKTIRSKHAHDTIVLYVISDGEQTSPNMRRSFSSLRQYLDAAFTVGVGSSKGGKIPQITAEPNSGSPSDDAGADNTQGKTQTKHWVTDPTTGQPGISKMDKASLKAIADEMSGKAVFINANSTMNSHDTAKTSSQWDIADTHKARERLNPVVWPIAIAVAALLCLELGSWLATSRRLL